MSRYLWPLIAFSPLFAAQIYTETVAPPQQSPPPPPPKVEEKPPTPARIRIGGNVTAAYMGPVPQWFNRGTASLSDQQITDLEATVAAQPGNACARGYLIAHGQDRVPHRLEHVLRMVENHPGWDGFLLSLSAQEAGGSYDRVKAAWLKHVEPDQRSGMVLHNASLFFGTREPEVAETLLQRAIRIEPDVLFHVEALGALYGGAMRWSPNSAFAEHATSIVFASSDWLIVAAAVEANRYTLDGAKSLRARLNELVWSPADKMRNLPSMSPQYRRYTCPFIPLLRTRP